MLNFLTTPYLILGAAAAAIPVILHLILRNRPETVYFAAMRFLVTTPKHLLRRQKLKQILLLLMRILALLLLGLAFARPLLTGKHVPTVLGREPRAMVLIVDVSASMAASNHLQSAVARASELLQQAAGGDRVSVLAAARRIEVLAENAKPAQALAALSSIKQGQTAGNLREAVLFADNMLAPSPLRRREIYVLSDFQASNFNAGQLKLNSSAECVALALENGWQNLALIGGERVEREGQTTYLCQVRSFANSDQDVEVNLVIDHRGARPAARQRVTVPAGEERTVRFSNFTAPAKNEREMRGAYFEIHAPSDEFAVDNRYFLAAEAERGARVLLVGGEVESEFFLQSALELPGLGYRVHRITANDLETTPLEAYAAVFFAGASGINRPAAEKLREDVRAGGGLIISLRENLPIETFNHFLAELLPGRIEEAIEVSQTRRENVALTEIDFAHPVFKIFRDPAHGDPSAVQITKYYRITPKPEAVRIAGFESGDPALLELGLGKGKTLLWASALNAGSGNFPVRGIFVPLIHQWLDYVRRTDTAPAMTHAGQPIFLSEAFTPDQPVKLTPPGGAEQSLPPLGTAAFTATEEAGLYHFRQGRASFVQAVNIDPRESDPAAISADDFTASLMRDNDQAAIASVFGTTEPLLQEQERQQRLWRFGLWALLALLLGECWLANRTPR